MNDIIRWIERRRRRGRSSRLGSALLIVLALVVLCAVVVLTFISQSMLSRSAARHSENAIKADLLARTAFDEVVLSLREEIFAGSTSATVSGVTIYSPATTISAFPSRSVGETIPASETNLATLIKQSAAAVPTYASTNLNQDYPASAAHPPRTPASTLSTSVPTRDGHMLSGRRWNFPRLLPGDGLADNQLPYWVYVTRSGPAEAATDDDAAGMADRDADNFSYAIGRYAYQVYDISGLLDINAAGHPTALTSSQVNELKGLLSGAVLEAIPGIDSPSDYMEWKAGELTADQYFTNQITNTNGFIKAAPGERRFFNRQDLLQYVSATNAIATDALPYLSVFSRKQNAPVFRYPQTAPAGQVAANATNASPLDIRMATAGSSAIDDFSWRAGDPVVPRRFPLSRLDWLRYDGPSEDVSAAEVKAAFGLVWDDREPNDADPASLRGDRWVYVGSNGSDDPDEPATEIKTLAQVAAEGREPNFFELLKAAIHRASLGQAVADSNAPNTDVLYGVEDLHILRIGACMIDQYDADSYPTLINMQVSDGAINPTVEVHGVENLPYISRVAPFYINPDWPNDPGPFNRRMQGFLAPELWNPHQPAVGAGPKPGELRLFYTGGHSLRTGHVSTYLDRNNSFNLATGAVTISGPAFGLFYQPRPVTESISVRTGNFSSQMPFKDFPVHSGDRVVGAELNLVGNMVAQPPYEPEASGHWWDGYYFNEGIYDLWIRDDFGGRAGENPFNAILQFKNHRGKFQNYNVLASGFYTSDPDLNLLVLGIQNNGGSPASGFKKEEFPIPYIPSGPAEAWKTTVAAPVSNAALADLQTIYRQGSRQIFKPDPRTARTGTPSYDFSKRNSTGTFDWTPSLSFAASLRPANAGDMARGPVQTYAVGTTSDTITFIASGNNNRSQPAMYERNVSADGLGMYYKDNDGVVRPGDNRFQAWADSVYNQSLSRPVVLDRPFRSVGELGYVFRDLPFRSLDLSSESSVDAALLDYFCVNESPPVVGGVVSLNTAPAPVLQSLLQGAGRTMDAATSISASEAQTLAGNVIARRQGSPAINVASLVPLTATNAVTAASTGLQPGIKTRREAVVRALASVHNERTWNLFIDVIAQPGKFPPNATKLSDFVVEGERRYWLHIAIDRYTGEVVDELRELVLE